MLDMLLWGPWSILILLPGIVLGIYAQMKVKSSFAKYSKISSQNGVSASNIAREMLNKAQIYDVRVQEISGNLTDNYNPKTEIVSLSSPVYKSTSVASIGVAAHEIGHVIQKHNNYLPMKIRSAIVPVVNIGSFAFMPLLLIGMLIEMFAQHMTGISNLLINLAIILYGGSTLFALITLPVELNASNRAKKLLYEQGILSREETKQASKVLSACALTYFASFVTSLLYFLRFLIIIGGMRRND